MGRPKGSKNRKTTLEIPNTLNHQDEPIQVLDARPFDLVLGIRRIREGNFCGLWELSELSINPIDAVTLRVLTDANVKSILMAKIGRALAQCR